MNREREGLSGIAELDDEDFILFQKTTRELVARSFILRGVSDRLYDFSVRNFHLLEVYFECMGAVLRKDEGLGVVAWRGGAETRVALGGDATCGLLVLRILYEEKRNAVRLAEFPAVTVFDFAQRYRANTERDLKKTKLAAMLHRFSMARLIKAPKDEGDPDALILLYPSLALALDQEGISEVLEWMKGARAGGQSGKAQTPGTGDEDDTEANGADDEGRIFIEPGEDES